ncbi:MAG: hypothetical protein ABSC05_38840 [Candidatus Solibacter sp.]|jgi:hypothetical protein
MPKSFRWPKDDRELKEREAAGLWQAQALAKEIGEGREKITLDLGPGADDLGTAPRAVSSTLY